MGYHVPNIRTSDSYALEVIAAILSRGRSSRLYRSLVQEKRLTLSADADHSLLSRDPGLFYIAAEPLPGKEVAEVEKALDQEIEHLQNELVGEEELEKAKNQLEAAFIYGQDSLFVQAILLAQYEITAGWKTIDHYMPSIRKVTSEDVRRVANQYLIQDNRTVGILVPLALQKRRPLPEGSPIRERTIQ